MPQSRSKYEFRQQASLAQKLAHKHPEYAEYAGADQKISISIAALNVAAAFDLIDSKDSGFLFVKAMLNELRKAILATSDKMNEITKMGLQMPKGASEIDLSEESEK